MRVGFVGLGHMGGPMAAHVAAAGHEVAAFDMRAERVAAVGSAAGGDRVRAASGAADAATASDVVSVVVLDDAQVLDVSLGAGGVVAAMHEGAVLAVHSTVTLECIRAVDAAARARGVQVLDAGISGGVPGAEAGTLVVIAGGTDEALERARPAFEPWAREVVHVGPLGTGMAAKVARNYVQYASFAIVHEAQALAAAAGVDLATFAHVIDATRVREALDGVLARPNATARPPDELGARGAALAEAVALARKDLDVAQAVAAEVGVELATLAGTRTSFGPALGVAADA